MISRTLHWMRLRRARMQHVGGELVERFVRPLVLRLRVRHISGLKRIAYGEAQVVAVCVVRNGQLHVRSFLDHHFALGVTHVVLLLNDSSDQTRAIAARYANVTLLAAGCPYAKYEKAMKRYLARRFSKGRWNLCVDIDELFDYPHSSTLPLQALLQYLNDQHYSAVVAQMLDMFAPGPLELVRSRPEDNLRSCFPFYDVSGVRKTDYIWSTLANPAVQMHWGGVREQVFGSHNGLTKAPLVKIRAEIKLFVACHQVSGASVADFTGVLLHYPFVETFRAKVADAVTTGRYGPATTREYDQYWSKVHGTASNVTLRRGTARELRDVDQLLGEGFLVAGPAFTRWHQAYLAGHARTS